MNRQCARCGQPLAPGMRSTARFCSDHCRKRQWEHDTFSACPSCGGPRAPKSRRRAAHVCHACRRAREQAATRRRYEIIQSLWHLPLTEIAKALGSTPDSVAQSAVRMRREGIPLPPRPRGRPKEHRT